MRERARVVEHRITSHYHGLLDHFVIRWWIESDPEFGGVDHATAHQIVSDAVAAVYNTARSLDRRLGDEWIAHFLLERVPASNSVEVCDEHGNGVTIHRDWP